MCWPVKDKPKVRCRDTLELMTTEISPPPAPGNVVGRRRYLNTLRVVTEGMKEKATVDGNFVLR